MKPVEHDLPLNWVNSSCALQLWIQEVIPAWKRTSMCLMSIANHPVRSFNQSNKQATKEKYL